MMGAGDVQFFLEYYRDKSMDDLRERLEICADSSVGVWPKCERTWKFKSGKGKRFYAQAPDISSLESWVNKTQDIVTYMQSEKPLLLS